MAPEPGAHLPLGAIWSERWDGRGLACTEAAPGRNGEGAPGERNVLRGCPRDPEGRRSWPALSDREVSPTTRSRECWTWLQGDSPPPGGWQLSEAAAGVPAGRRQWSHDSAPLCPSCPGPQRGTPCPGRPDKQRPAPRLQVFPGTLPPPRRAKVRLGSGVSIRAVKAESRVAPPSVPPISCKIF